MPPRKSAYAAQQHTHSSYIPIINAWDLEKHFVEIENFYSPNHAVHIVLQMQHAARLPQDSYVALDLLA